MTVPLSILTGGQTPVGEEKEKKAEGQKAQAEQQAQAQASAAQPAQPQAPPPTFAQLQAMGVARPPAPMASMGGNVGGGSPDMRGYIQSLVANPSGDTGYLDAKIAREGQKIDEDFGMRNTQIREEMARRGLMDSTFYGGRLQDSAAMRKGAKEDLVARLYEEQQGKDSENRFRAGSMAMSLLGLDQEANIAKQQMDLENMRAQAQIQMQREQLALDKEVAAGRMTIDQARLQLESTRAALEDQYRRAELGFRERAHGEELSQRRTESERDYGFRTSEANRAAEQWQKSYDQRGSQFETETMLRLLDLLGINLVGYGEEEGAGTTPTGGETAGGGTPTGGGTGYSGGGVPDKGVPENPFTGGGQDFLKHILPMDPDQLTEWFDKQPRYET